MSNVIDIVVKAKDETQKAFSGAEQGASSFGDRMKKVNKVAVGASLAIGAGLVKVGMDSVEVSRRMGDLDTKARTVFEGSLGKVEAWAEANKKAFGTSEREVVGLAAGFADLLKPMGFTADQAADMSTEVLDLSGALSKWSGGQYEAAEVADVLSKAMLGETDGLKALGISISAAEVEAQALKMGLVESEVEMTKVNSATVNLEKAQRAHTEALKENGKGSLEARDAAAKVAAAQSALEKVTAGTKGEITAQAKALATQELIMNKSTDAQAAWAEGGKEAASAEGALKSAMAETSETVAGLLTPAIERGTEELAKFADWADKNQGTVMALGGVLAGLAATVLVVNAAVKVYTATKVVWAAATKAVTVAQKALNLALRMNPIGLVITAIAALVAGLVLAYKKSETFRNIVDGAFKAVAATGKWLWEKVLKPSFDGMKKGFAAVGKAGTWLWNNALQPTFRFIVKGVGGLMQMWGKMLQALGKVPGFGWASKAGDKMTAAGQDAVAMADKIEKIPSRKEVKIAANLRAANQAIDYTAGQIRNLQSLAARGIRVAGVTGKGGHLAGNRAMGGPVRAGQPYAVGDNPDGSWNKTTELFVPDTSGRIFNQRQLRAAGAGGRGGGEAGGSGGRIVLEIASSGGSDFERMFVEMIRKYVRVQGGGSAQVALGRN